MCNVNTTVERGVKHETSLEWGVSVSDKIEPQHIHCTFSYCIFKYFCCQNLFSVLLTHFAGVNYMYIEPIHMTSRRPCWCSKTTLRLRAVPVQSVESKRGRTGDGEMAERETGERREEEGLPPFPPPPQLPLGFLFFAVSLASLDFLSRVTILRDC